MKRLIVKLIQKILFGEPATGINIISRKPILNTTIPDGYSDKGFNNWAETINSQVKEKK